MLDIDPHHWWYKERKEGWEIGKEEGKEEGLAEGQNLGQPRLLISQLENKFGPLPIAIQQRLQAASIEKRGRWALRLLHASSLPEVF